MAAMNYADVEEVVLTEECKSLLQTLPSEKGLLYLYRGFWYFKSHLNGVLSVEQNYSQGRADQYSGMILLATNPKSGTTWLKALLFTLLNRSHHSPTSNNHPLLQDHPQSLVPSLEIATQRPNVEKHSPMTMKLFATHIPFSTLPSSITSSNCKIVYLCRNPKDTFISSWHFAIKLKHIGSDKASLDEAFDKFCRGVSPFRPYWDHVMEYWKASQEMPDKVLFVKFEEIKKQPGDQLRRMARFLVCPFSQEEESSGQVEEIIRLCSFNNLSRLEGNQTGKLLTGREKNAFFRKGEVGDWVNYLTDEMIERVDRITEEKLRGSTLTL